MLVDDAIIKIIYYCFLNRMESTRWRDRVAVSRYLMASFVMYLNVENQSKGYTFVSIESPISIYTILVTFCNIDCCDCSGDDFDICVDCVVMGGYGCYNSGHYLAWGVQPLRFPGQELDEVG